jgi:NAD(P)-dependent dehydrogenase (short-subunit alcohol dehydrogenase family)
MAFRGRVALVTGAASGIGRRAVQRLAGHGARVAALDVDEEGLHDVARSLPNVLTWRVDVTDRREVVKAVADAEAELGHVDRVVCAAGIMPTGPLLQQGVETLHRVMEVNYGGTVNVALAALPRMLARERGDLILLASIAGWIPTLHLGAYAASNSAVVAFSEVLHHETRGRGIRIACVCPSRVATPLLGQAKSLPRVLRVGPPPLQPDHVLDPAEDALEAGRLFVFPGWRTAVGWRLRRFLPGLLWRTHHRVEEV